MCDGIAIIRPGSHYVRTGFFHEQFDRAAPEDADIQTASKSGHALQRRMAAESPDSPILQRRRTAEIYSRPPAQGLLK